MDAIDPGLAKAIMQTYPTLPHWAMNLITPGQVIDAMQIQEMEDAITHLEQLSFDEACEQDIPKTEQKDRYLLLLSILKNYGFENLPAGYTIYENTVKPFLDANPVP